MNTFPTTRVNEDAALDQTMCLRGRRTMSHHHGVMAGQQATRYLLIPQGTMILKPIADSDGHISAQEIHERLQAAHSCLDVSAVYASPDLPKTVRLGRETEMDRRHCVMNC